MAKLNITTNEGVLLEQIELDEYDLRRSTACNAIMDEIVRNVRTSGEGRTNDPTASPQIGKVNERKYSVVGINAMRERVSIAHRDTQEEAEAFTRTDFCQHYTDVTIIPPAAPRP